MSPHIQIEVHNVTYNYATKELFVEVVQKFHIRWNPLPAAPSRSVLSLLTFIHICIIVPLSPSHPRAPRSTHLRLMRSQTVPAGYSCTSSSM